MEGIMHRTTATTAHTTRNISVMSAFGWVVECTKVASQRRTLAKLSWSALDDIGVNEVQAMREAHKPFWA